MKKILIFGMPRSGTTLLQKHLAQSLNLWGYKEPFSDQEYRTSIGDPYQWAANLNHAVVKVLAQNLDYVDLVKLINAGKFDSIVVTKRKNLTDLCISLYYAEQITRNYHYTNQSKIENIVPFLVPTEFINGYLVPYRWYLNTMQEIDQHKIPYITFNYEQYQAGETQIIHGVEFCLAKESNYGIDTVASNINYRQVCLNYNEIAGIIAHENYN
jgi:hypothetical protein